MTGDRVRGGHGAAELARSQHRGTPSSNGLRQSGNLSLQDPSAVGGGGRQVQPAAVADDRYRRHPTAVDQKLHGARVRHLWQFLEGIHTNRKEMLVKTRPGVRYAIRSHLHTHTHVFFTCMHAQEASTFQRARKTGIRGKSRPNPTKKKQKMAQGSRSVCPTCSAFPRHATGNQPRASDYLGPSPAPTCELLWFPHTQDPRTSAGPSRRHPRAPASPMLLLLLPLPPSPPPPPPVAERRRLAS